MSKIIHVDDRGYCLVLNDDGTYTAGCRKNWTREHAIEHWSDEDYPDPARGRAFVEAIERGEEITVLPDGLWRLSLDGGTLPEGTEIPKGCEVYK